MSENGKRGGSGGVQAVERALDLLDLLTVTGDSQSASSLSREAGLPYATVHRLLQTLTDRGYVRHDPQSKGYSLGPTLVLAGAHVDRLLTQWVQPYLRELVEFSGETANMAVLDDGYVTYVAQAQSQQRLRMFTQVGNRVLPHATAVGKVLLAHRPRTEAEATLTRMGMPAQTRNTITDLQRFLRELDEVASQGYAIDDEEGEIGVRCVAVPLFGIGGTAAAVSISGPAARLSRSVLAQLVSKMHQVAADFAASLTPPAASMGMVAPSLDVAGDDS